ncbi:MAG: hypothetical protein UU09_C0037G0021 [Microgenomates group bacterium GW2011_GWA2_40_6]|nr:MAG: hypothetical protein UU09_C0037G0021 [Microgenomates group bacterium GW2011_GWA2_40_6]
MNFIKEMKKNKILLTLIPVVAIVIIIESVIFLGRSTKKLGPQLLKVGSNIPVSLNWKADKEVVIGKSDEVILNMTTKKDVAIDAVDLYIKYDPSQVSIEEIVVDKSFVKPSFSKINPEKGLVVVNYLVSAPKGFELKTGTGIDLAKLKVNYLGEGEVSFEVGEGTVVVENGSAKVLPFNSSGLIVKVTSGQ